MAEPAVAISPSDRAAAFAAQDEERRLLRMQRQWEALAAARISGLHPAFSSEHYVHEAALDWWESSLRRGGALDWQTRHPPVGVLAPRSLSRLDGQASDQREANLSGHEQFRRGEYLWSLAVRAAPYPRGAVAFYGPEDSATYLRQTMWNQDMAAEPERQREIDMRGMVATCLLQTIARYRLQPLELLSLEAAVVSTGDYAPMHAEQRLGRWRYSTFTNDGRALAVVAVTEGPAEGLDVFVFRGVPVAGAGMAVAARLAVIESSLLSASSGGTNLRPDK